MSRFPARECGRLFARHPCHRTDVPIATGYQQSGVALLFVLLIMVASSLILISQSRRATVDVKISHNYLLHEQALSAAEAGIEHAVNLLSASNNSLTEELAGDGVDGAITAIGAATTHGPDALSYRFRSFSGSGTDGYYVRLLDNADDVPASANTDTDSIILVRSVGRSATAERSVEIKIRKKSGYGLYGKTQLLLTGGGDVDSYDSTAGPYPAGDNDQALIGSNALVTLVNATSEVNGSVHSAGTVSNGGVVTGSVETGTDPVVFDSVAACGPAYSPDSGMTGNYSYNPATGNLSIGGGWHAVNLSAGTYCFNDISSAGTVNLVSTPVIINLTGNANFGGNGISNPTFQPDQLQINLTGGSFTFQGGSNGYMSIYAPDSAIRFAGGATMHGTAVGDTIQLTGGMQFHIDTSSVSGNKVERLSWREVGL